MKAAILHGGAKTLAIEDITVPRPAPGEALIKVAACGVCHTDLHYIDHGVPTFRKPPITLGHEASGTIIMEWEKFRPGDRVLIPPVFSCGECKLCKADRDNICTNQKILGSSINGAFAQYVKVPEKDLMRLPDEIPLEEGCIIADAISTPYHAVMNRAKIQAGQRVIVFGCGGVGINVVQIAALAGAEVTSCDISSEKLEAALELGATYVLRPEEIKNKYDVAFEVVGKPETIQAAYKTLDKAGRLVVVGYTNRNITINPAKIMFFEQEIIGSIGCRTSDYPKIFDLVISGKIKLDRLINNRYPLEEINRALDELREGKVLRNIILPNA